MKTMLTTLARALIALSRVINTACWILAGFCLIAMLAAVGVQVAGRYILFSAPSWTEEFARYAMVWTGLLGATVSFHEQQDPVIVNLPTPTTPGMQRLIEIVKAVPVFIFLSPLLLYSPVIIAHHMERLTESMKITSGYVLLIVPVFAWVLLLHQSARLAGTAMISVADQSHDLK